jgi:phospholipase C
MMKRREALKTIGGLAAAGGAVKYLPGCGGGDGDGPPDSRPPAGPTTVVLMMENRSYDHSLGARSLLEGKPGDGLTALMNNPDAMGTLIAPYEATFETGCVIDPPHGWNAWDVQSDGGTNNGFIRAYEEDAGPGAIACMQYQTRATQPASWAIADNYASFDRWFCSVRGPTWPNRMYWHSGQSAGIMSNDFPTQGFNWDTLYHRLDAKGVQWAYYYGDIPVISVIETIPTEGKIKRFEDFFQDCEAGILPPVVYIDPVFSGIGNDDHPPKHPMLGQGLIASIYVALANSPHWNQCLFLVTYDENGGFFDHVPPPTTADDFASTGFDQLGFRVPTIMAGPYVKPGYVSSVVCDHTSVLKHFEVKHGLDPLTMRSTAANDIVDAIDVARMAANQPAPPAAIPPIELDLEMIEMACNPTSLKPEDHPLVAWADANKHRLGALDRRAHARETVENIFWYLDKHNAGRLVK